ncbi:MAG TPA: anhydro-N-acetylmuramic acid kinase [Flavobacterium sp.]|jgi:anhydro-N-acetylmuramic acid kinase
MFKDRYTIIGVMSGTSLDGIDLAHIIFSLKGGIWNFEIFESETIPYTDYWLNKLKAAVNYPDAALQALNREYTVLLGKTINQFIQQNDIQHIDAVCSHGHTILHQPQNKYTLQIGNLPEIKQIVAQTIVCDFRVQDVQLGGQGAPLVPIGDRILFSEFDYCLNLGGFSNISFESDTRRIAFDISPVNTVLNFYANTLRLDYDDKGNISRSGKLNGTLLEALNALDYYKNPYPKSLGFEFVKETVLPLIEKYPIPVEDKMHTFTEHVAIQINMALTKKETQMLITGGGAYNEFLIERIRFHLPGTTIIIPDKKTIEFKEALIFGLLGVLKLRNEINVLSSVTGAKCDHSSGTVYSL